MKTAKQEIEQSRSEMIEAIKEMEKLLEKARQNVKKMDEMVNPAPKFKVGDRVRIIANRHSHGFEINEVVTISKMDEINSRYSAINSNSVSWWVEDNEIELAPDRIRVPENIKFEFVYGSMLLISPNGKCALSASPSNNGVPLCLSSAFYEDSDFAITDPLYLEPCKREDLKCGDVAIGHYGEAITRIYDDVEMYSVILNGEEVVEWDKEMDTAICNETYPYWYKVVR